MTISALSSNLKSFRWVLAIAALAFVFALFFVTARPALGVGVEVSAAGGSGVLAGETVPVRVENAFGASETVDTQDLVIEIIGAQSFSFTVPIEDDVSVTSHSGSGILRGNVTHTAGIMPGASTIGADGNGGTITFNGSFTVPFSALPGQYTVRARLLDSNETFQGIGQFTILDETVDEEPDEPGGTSPTYRMAISNSVHIPGSVLSNLQSQTRTALGDSGISMLGGNSPIVNEDGNMVLRLPGLGINSSMSVNGPINIDAPQIQMSTNNGSGTATLGLGDGIVMTADVTVEPGSSRLNVVLSNAVISFGVPTPDVELITGGASSVTGIGSAFEVGITGLPAGSALEFTYAKDAGSFFSGPADVFGEAAEDLGGELDSLTDDVAFVVQATTEGISNSDLGSNQVTLTVNNAWYDEQSSDGNTVAILKRDDSGNVYAAEASCSAAGGDMMSCTATFSDDAGGFSSFALFGAAEEEEEPTPTAEPTEPAPTEPAPTNTPDGETPVSEDSNLALIIIVVVVVLAVAGGAAFVLMRRKPTGE